MNVFHSSLLVWMSFIVLACESLHMSAVCASGAGAMNMQICVSVPIFFFSFSFLHHVTVAVFQNSFNRCFLTFLSPPRRIRAAGGRLLQTASCWLLGKTRALFRGHQVHGQFMKHLCFGNKSGEKKVKSGMGSPDWSVSVVNVHLWKLLWVYHLDMEWRGMT